MGETADPCEGLTSTDVAVRAAAVRELAAAGTWDDVPRLIDVARQDKSPSVRLYAAAAAADVVMRHRGAAGQTRLTPAQRKDLLKRVASYDPLHNPSLLMVLAALPDPEGLERLGRLLRDPRQDVRNGAVTALRRMVGSAAALEEPALGETIGHWLAGGKHPPDTIAELVRIAGEAGLPGLEDAILRAVPTGRAAAIAGEEALARFASRRDPEGWVGLWVSRGSDAGQPDGAAVEDFLWVDPDGAAGPAGVLGPIEIGADGSARLADAPARRIWASRPGTTGSQEALQWRGRTYWRESGRAIVKAVDELDLSAAPAVALGLARGLEGLDGVTAQRARAIALWRGGRLADAEQALASLLEDKPKPDLLWVAANVQLGLGDLDSARRHLRAALEGAPKKAPWRGDAEQLLASLGG